MTTDRPDILEFGPFELDRDRKQLRRRGRRVPLQDLPLRLLLELLAKPGEIVSRDALHERLWPGVRVDFALGLAKAAHKLRGALSDRAEEGRYIETVRGRGYRFVAPVRQRGAMPDVPPASREQPTVLAILPFHLLDGEPLETALGFGIADDLATRLASHAGFAIRPMSAVLRAHGEGHRDALSVGHELATTHVLEGTLRQRGDECFLNVRLVSVANAGLVWGEAFEVPVARPLAGRSRLAEAVLAAIPGATVSQEGRARDSTSEDGRAQVAYLKGRLWFERRFEVGLKAAGERAIACFQEAVRNDPGFAAAHAGIALASTPALTWGLVPLDEGLPVLRRAAMRAAELAPELPATQEALAMCCSLDWDWAGEERAHRRALELDPNYLIALTWYEVLLECQGRWDEALGLARRALQSDPGSPHANLCFATALHRTGADRAAIAHLRERLDARPQERRSRMLLGHIHFQEGRSEDGLEEFEAAGHLATFAWALGTAGQRAKACEVRDRLEADERLWPLDRAAICAGLGETHAALDLLEAALAERRPFLMLLRSDERFTPLHAEPRFSAVLEQVGLPAV